MWRVPAGLNLRPGGPQGQSGLGHLQWRSHASDGGLEVVDVLLLVVDLLHGPGQVGLEAGVGTLGAGDPLLECLVGVSPVLVEVVVLRVEKVVHSGPQSLGPGPRTLGRLDIVLGEVGPSLGDADGAVYLLNSSVEISRAEGHIQSTKKLVVLPGVVVEPSGHVVDTQGRIFVVQVQLQLVPSEPVGADLLIDLTEIFLF